ncbi:hypothetical protein KIJ96_21060 (plasmid) [Pseudoalteromonas piscicida]|uniref:hypothetical protein n=1 Tax=Pseudoalteromonas piscicida TaxID=43662 RepID=UPI001D0B9079|nr:hypothetical protein [Pseudoalteromonas piscicida]UDM63453.1 hypothetical protein KIJ96_21060 [Pseudoalteromonas piscicida]
MIESSLNSVRNLHRLIMAVAFITLVFSLSLSLPSNKQRQLEAIESLVNFEFDTYEKFVNKKVDEYVSSYYEGIDKTLASSIEKDEYLIFDINKISQAFSTTPHVGKLLVDELVLSSPTNATLNSFDALNGLATGKNVQIVVPEVSEIIPLLHDFLEAGSIQAGKRVDNVSLSIGDYSFYAESFIPDDGVTVSLYFELPEKVRTGGAPVFNVDFSGTVVSIPNTSFNEWLSKQPNSINIASVRADHIFWLPDLGDVPSGFKEKKLGLLANELKNEIKKTSPSEQKVSFLGANIPGILFIYASPALLIGFLYYLSSHLKHLVSLSKDHNNLRVILQFPWIPLSGVRHWKADFLVTTCILPTTSLLVLYIQISRFGNVGLLSMALILTCIIVSVHSARNMLIDLKRVRANVYDRKKNLTRKFSRRNKLRS